MSTNYKREMKKIDFIPYAKQWIDKGDIKDALKVLQSDWLTQGPAVDAFEKAVARYTGAAYAVAVSSGTGALHIAYAASIKKGDEVITTPLTFAATSNMLIHLGAKPVFVDINPDTLTLDARQIEKKITKKTKAIAPVDFAGHPCEYDQIQRIAKKHRLLVIVDAAHALGSVYKNKQIGSLADITILSFHPVKTITTGEGGMILTSRKDFAQKMRILRHHGIIKKPEQGAWYYEIEYPGFNYRITDFQCALGLSQFKKLGSFIKRRQEIVEIYNHAFARIPEIITPKSKSYAKPAWHLYIIQLQLAKLRVDRRKIFEALQKAGIGVQVHYMPLHLHPFYQKTFGYKKGDFPIAEMYYERAISLPLFPKMKAQEIRYIINTVKNILKKFTL